MSQATKALGGAVGLGALAYAAQQLNFFGPSTTPDERSKKLTNRAFVFVKPHAATPETEKLVREQLKEKGMKIHKEGDIDSKDIDEKKYIDQHYYAIASKATMKKPEELNIPEDKFKDFFGKSWQDVLKEKKAYNALDACKELGVDASEMAKLWADAKKNKRLVKFGGGFYCGEIKAKGKTLYVFNGFFMEMRNAFTAPGRKIHYYDVEWDEKTMPWADFRGKLLGPTDPKEAPQDSLRGVVMREWKRLGLGAEPNVGDNAVHASASPFEGLAERMNWLAVKCQDDDYCRALIKAGVPEKLIEEWTRDPQVPVTEDKKTKKSLFDSLEDQDAEECLKTAQKLAKYA